MPLEETTQTPKVQYSCTIDLSNPNENISPKFPLIQGTSVELYVTVKDNGVVIHFESVDDITGYIASYCKLDNAPVISANLDIELEEPTGSNVLVITGVNLTNTAGKNALILKYSNGYTTYSTPLYYYVEFNPISQLPLPINE
jgi:hypothetical protein